MPAIKIPALSMYVAKFSAARQAVIFTRDVAAAKRFANPFAASAWLVAHAGKGWGLELCAAKVVIL